MSDFGSCRNIIGTKILFSLEELKLIQKLIDVKSFGLFNNKPFSIRLNNMGQNNKRVPDS